MLSPLSLPTCAKGGIEPTRQAVHKRQKEATCTKDLSATNRKVQHGFRRRILRAAFFAATSAIATLLPFNSEGGEGGEGIMALHAFCPFQSTKGRRRRAANYYLRGVAAVFCVCLSQRVERELLAAGASPVVVVVGSVEGNLSMDKVASVRNAIWEGSSRSRRGRRRSPLMVV